MDNQRKRTASQVIVNSIRLAQDLGMGRREGNNYIWKKLNEELNVDSLPEAERNSIAGIMGGKMKGLWPKTEQKKRRKTKKSLSNDYPVFVGPPLENTFSNAVPTSLHGLYEYMASVFHFIPANKIMNLILRKYGESDYAGTTELSKLKARGTYKLTETEYGFKCSPIDLISEEICILRQRISELENIQKIKAVTKFEE